MVEFYAGAGIVPRMNPFMCTHSCLILSVFRQAPRYDADKIVDALRKKLGRGGTFNWVALGREAGICFNSIPSDVAFLSGPLKDGQEEIQVKQRAKPQRRRKEDDTAEEERPEDVKGHTERGVDHLSAHEKNVDVVLATLRKKSDYQYKTNKKRLQEKYGSEIPPKATKKLKRGGGTCAVNLLFNPKSFTQTVENVFHYSYLVKKGSAQLTVRGKDVEYEGDILSKAGPLAAIVRHKKEQSHPPARQSIVTLTMKDWRDMIDAYGVEKSDIPHRMGSKMKKMASPAAKRAVNEEEEVDDEEEDHK